MNTKMQALALAGSAVLAMGLGATSAQADPVTRQVTAKAKVLKQITVTKNSDLDFGTVLAGTAGTVAINANGARTCTGVQCITTTGNTGTSASFTVTGTNNQVVTVTTPQTPLTLSNGAGGTMSASITPVSAFNLGNSGSTGTNFGVGGTLTVSATQADGVYTSPSFDVTVDYQ